MSSIFEVYIIKNIYGQNSEEIIITKMVFHRPYWIKIYFSLIMIDKINLEFLLLHLIFNLFFS